MTAATIDLAALDNPTWDETERSNVRTMADFVQLLMNDHDFDAVRERFSTGTYVQHNRSIPDGIDGLIGYVSQLVKRFPDYSYDVRQIVASGDRVIFHSHATLKSEHRGDESRGFNIFDMWRLEDGKIANHWDSLQALDFSSRLIALAGGGRIKNDNGVF